MRTPASPLGEPVAPRPDSPWNLRPWRYDGDMNADHFSGEMGFSNNGSGVQVIFRAGGEVFSAWVSNRELRDLIEPAKGQWSEHGKWIKANASGYATDGRLRILEPTCHLDWVDNYPDLFRKTA